MSNTSPGQNEAQTESVPRARAAKAEPEATKTWTEDGKMSRAEWMANSTNFAQNRAAGVGFDRWCIREKKPFRATNAEFEGIFTEFLNHTPK